MLSDGCIFVWYHDIFMMKADLRYAQMSVSVDFSKPIPLSLPIRRDHCNPNAYFLPAPLFEPFRAQGFIGSVAEGGPVNCELIHLAPHGNGTHTECVGHISRETRYLCDCAFESLSFARLARVQPEPRDGDEVISLHSVRDALRGFQGSSLVLRTSSSAQDYRNRQWSGSNPPYCEAGVGTLLCEHGISNFLVDVPSVDRESDEGKLQVHHEFWQYPQNPRLHATITELIVVPDEIEDGDYLLSIAVPTIQSDAAPSTVCLYRLEPQIPV